MEPKVIFEDTDVLVINKPAGLIVHSDGRTHEASVAEWVVEKYPDMRDVGEPWTSPQGEVIARPGIVHRLDRTTSGVMILAKHQDAHAFLRAQFQNRETEKEYRAFVYGHPKEDSGTIEREIVRLRTVPPRWGVAHTDSKPGRAAVTAWQMLARATERETEEKVSYLSIFPKTGRTHQIRVHLKALQYPIVSDHLYAATKPQILGFTRPALHAFRLSITLPSGSLKTFEAPLPEDFENALRKLGI